MTMLILGDCGHRCTHAHTTTQTTQRQAPLAGQGEQPTSDKNRHEQKQHFGDETKHLERNSHVLHYKNGTLKKEQFITHMRNASNPDAGHGTKTLPVRLTKICPRLEIK